MAVVLCGVIGPSVGSSQSIDAARTLYSNGDFTHAAEIAKKLGTFEGHLIATDALSVHGAYFVSGKERQRILTEAIEQARMAVELEPNNPEAHLHLSRAMGRYAQSISAGRALSEGYGEAVKDTLDTVLRLDPDRWEAHLVLGAWHSEIVAKGGFLAMLAFGASKKKALAHFAKAADLAPNSAIVHLEYARGLLRLDPGENRAAIVQHLRRAVEAPANDAFDRIIRKEAKDMLSEY